MSRQADFMQPVFHGPSSHSVWFSWSAKIWAARRCSNMERLTLRSTAKARSIGEVFFMGHSEKQNTKLQAASNSKQMTCFLSNSFVSGGFSHRAFCGIPAAVGRRPKWRGSSQKISPKRNPAEVLSLSWLMMLLEEIRRSPPGMYKSLVNNGINYLSTG